MFTTTFVLQALLLLFVKHFIADFPLQKWAYQYANKGTYGHPGGLLHAGIHVIGTFAVFMFMFDQLSLAAVYVAGFLALLDGVIHYHVDWAKMSLNKAKGWGPNTHNEFWVLLGVDQLLHALTYILLVSLLCFENIFVLFTFF